LSVLDSHGAELLAYQPEEIPDQNLPAAASEPLPPEKIASVDELYLTGLHLEQYRHATRSPEIYWREGLKRDPEDSRINNAVGITYLRQGSFAQAEECFNRSIRRLTLRNPNPYDGEPFYNRGLAYLYQSNNSDAYDAFHKSVWSYARRSAGYYQLASISTARGQLLLALEQVERSLEVSGANLNALALKASVLRLLGRSDEARALVDGTLALDRLCFRMMAERYLLSNDQRDLITFLSELEGDTQTLLDVGYDLAWSGLREDAYTFLTACSREAQWVYPMFWYTLSWLAHLLGHEQRCEQYAAVAEAASPRYCFPARIEEMIVLEDCLQRRPSSAKAQYYLGNLYYDRRRYDDAIRSWRRSVELDANFSIPWRNLGIAEFNVLHNPDEALRMYTRAFAADPEDARVLYELDQLKRRARLGTPEERFRTLDKHRPLVECRDDLCVEYITLLNQCGRWDEALRRLSTRRFNPWEGGEGLVSAQYVHAHRALGREAMYSGRDREALEHFEAARHYPENLGEGKHLLTPEHDLDYYSGLAAQRLGDLELARQYWRAATKPHANFGVHSYFQALALHALGDDEAALKLFNGLADFAEKQMAAEPSIDYFATSLPNLLLFEDDLDKGNRVESLLLSALASHGLDGAQAAIHQLEGVLAEDANHQFAAETLRWLNALSVKEARAHREQTAL